MKRTELIRKILHENDDLDFLDTNWQRSKDIANNIKTNLPNIEPKLKPKGDYWGVIDYSELGNTWDVGSLYGKSEALDALADKISYMIYNGMSDGIKRMLESISNNTVKTLYRGKKASDKTGPERESLGKGHFRWNYRAYLLTSEELTYLKKFFGL